MANTVQIKRGNNTSVNAHTGPSGELIYNLDTGRLHAQDGSTAGGKPHALISDVDLKANAAVNIIAGTGLTGGGTLAASRTLALSSASIASLAKADTAVQPAIEITAGTGLTGGGTLAASRTLALNATSIASLAKADSAIQAPGGTTGQVLAKNSNTTNDVVWVSSEAATAVSYGAQTLTAAQQTQARQNIQADKSYDSIASVAASTVPAFANAIYLSGYYAAGDGGGALYKRVAVEPVHAGKLKSADGAWWEIVEPVLRPEMFGVIGDGTDETTAMHKAMRTAEFLRLTLLMSNKRYGYTRISLNYAVWEGVHGTEMFSYDTDPIDDQNDYFTRVDGTNIGNLEVSGYSARMSNLINVGGRSTDDLEGCLLQISSNRLIHNQASGVSWRLGELALVKNVRSASTLELSDPLFHNYFQNGNTVTAIITEVISDSQVKCNALNQNSNVMGYPAAVNGQNTNISAWSNSTKIMTFKTPVTGMAAGQGIIVDRSSSISIRRPGVCSIKNIKFIRPPQIGAASGDIGFMGLRIRSCLRPELVNVSSEGFSHVGNMVHVCYESYLENVGGIGANRAYDDGDGTGYGILLSGNRRSMVINCYAIGCRKGLDVQGPNISDIGNKTINFRNVGGGYTYQGKAFFPAGTTQTHGSINAGEPNTGLGSHEGTFGSTYENCIAHETFMPVSLRGVSEVVTGLTYHGNCLIPVRTMFADNVTVDGVYSADDAIAAVEPTYNPLITHYPIHGVLIWNTNSPENGVQSTGIYVFKNFVLRGISGSFIRIDRAGLAPKVIYGGNIVNQRSSGTFEWLTSHAGADITSPAVDAGGNVVF